MIIGDGGMATALQSLGLLLGSAPESWLLSRREAVTRVHRESAAAGAGWLTLNTFGASRGRLAGWGAAGETAEINRAAVRAAREAAGRLPLVASLGPPQPQVDAEEDYAEQVHLLAGEGITCFLIETAVSLTESLAALRAAVGVGEAWVSFTPDDRGDLYDGTRLERAAEAWIAAGARVIGVNCGTGPESLKDPIRRLIALDLAPVYAAPSAGLPVSGADQQSAGASGARGGGRGALHVNLPGYPVSQACFAGAAIEFAGLGVARFAGCCGVSAAMIAAAVKQTAAAQRS